MSNRTDCLKPRINPGTCTHVRSLSAWSAQPQWFDYFFKPFFARSKISFSCLLPFKNSKQFCVSKGLGECHQCGVDLWQGEDDPKTCCRQKSKIANGMDSSRPCDWVLPSNNTYLGHTLHDIIHARSQTWWHNSCWGWRDTIWLHMRAIKATNLFSAFWQHHYLYALLSL